MLIGFVTLGHMYIFAYSQLEVLATLFKQTVHNGVFSKFPAGIY